MMKFNLLNGVIRSKQKKTNPKVETDKGEELFPAKEVGRSVHNNSLKGARPYFPVRGFARTNHRPTKHTLFIDKG